MLGTGTMPVRGPAASDSIGGHLRSKELSIFGHTSGWTGAAGMENPIECDCAIVHHPMYTYLVSICSSVTKTFTKKLESLAKFMPNEA